MRSQSKVFLLIGAILCLALSSITQFSSTQDEYRRHDEQDVVAGGQELHHATNNNLTTSKRNNTISHHRLNVEDPSKANQTTIAAARLHHEARPLPPLVKTNDNVHATTSHQHHQVPNSSCWSLNSKTWLESSRYGNEDDGMDDDFVRKMILELPLEPVLQNTICLEDSRFLNPTFNNQSTGEDKDDSYVVRLWAVRLVYMALHYHQHHWAIPEARLRLGHHPDCHGEPVATTTAAPDNNNSSTIKHHNDVKRFDYECPDAKFMIVPLKPHGLGANIRTGIIPALLVGLVANRVVIFVNQAPDGNYDVRNPWPLASCERKDYQCVFLPSSPCVLTHEDIAQAHVFEDRVAFRRALKKSQPPSGFDDAKVWLFRKASGHTVQLPQLAVERLQNYSRHLLFESSSSSSSFVVNNDAQLPILRRAIDAISEIDTKRDGMNYAMATMKVHHALAFYALRPNIPSREKLRAIRRDIVPSGLNPEQTIGLPVRGSDKCRKESECLSFAEHMQAVSEVWTKHLNTSNSSSRRPSVVFTTESQSIVQEQQSYAAASSSSQSSPFSFDFVTNTHDVTPDTGFLAKSSQNVSADDAMLSSLSSFQAQLLARATVGNCCSHYHHLLNDFLMEGCGAASRNTYMCLQDSENPMLRVCCAWHKKCKRVVPPNATAAAEG